MTQTTEQERAPELVAAVDLGSNSFHMIVCSVHKGQLKILDRLREMVQLASGLNDKNILDESTQQCALACLNRFGQRIQNFPESNVHIVGTNTLRIAKNSQQFLQKAERTIGYPIHIISGIEEARLIYQGVAYNLQSNANRRLVMDIGGGSTEYIIGTNFDPAQKASLCMGCVTLSNQFFSNGTISQRRFEQAQIFVNQQLNTYRNLFNHNHWDETIGASGSIRSIRKVLLATEWSKGGITLAGLEKLKQHALNCKQVSELDLPGLDQERLPVFMGGLVILYTTFKTLNIDKMSVSSGALREGLIYDYLGRMFNHDVRSDTARLLAEHYHTDTHQTKRIQTTIAVILKQVRPFLGVQSKIMHQYLNWAAELHEIGRNIAHSQYHKHGAYIIKHGDLAGFSQQDQSLLSILVLAHRRKIPLKLIKQLPPSWNNIAIYMVIILRVAVILQRNRSNSVTPEFTMTLTPKTINIEFHEHWLDNAPLTQADLKLEEAYLAKAKFSLHTR